MEKKMTEFPILKVAYNDALTNYLLDNNNPKVDEAFEENYPEKWAKLTAHKSAIYALYAAIEPRFDELQLILHDVDKCKSPTEVEHKLYAPHHMLCRPWSYGECYLDSYTLLEIALDVITAHYIKHNGGDTPILIPCHPSIPLSVRQLLMNTIEFVRLGLSRNLRNEVKDYDEIFEDYPELEQFAKTTQYKVNFIHPEPSVMEAGARAQEEYEHDDHVTHLIFALPGMGKTTAMKKLNLLGHFAVDFDLHVKGDMKVNLRTEHMRRATTAYINQLAIQNCDFVFGWYDQIDFTTLDWSRIDIWVFMPYDIYFAIDNARKRVNGQKSKFNDEYVKEGAHWYAGWNAFIDKMKDNPRFHALYSDYYVSHFITKYFNIDLTDDKILEGEN